MLASDDQGSSPHWHDREASDALTELRASPEGLSEDEAASRLRAHGPNRLPPPRRPSALARFLLQFHNVLIYVLLGAAVITAALEHWIDTFVILAVVLANAVIGFIQEGKAETAMNAIREMLAPRASVIRAGVRRSVPGETVVPGDIVLLEAGDKVPADLRLTHAHGLQIDEAILTGESVPVDKQTGPVAPDAALGDRTCVAFSGTLVTTGQGRGVVIATGAATEIGRISGMLSEVQKLTTPLVRQMDAFARWLTVLILSIAGALLAFGYFVQNQDFAEIFMAVVGLSVAAIPEGLPAILTITLAVGVRAMAARNAIVRRLPAIETLGSVSVICTDKTGTLTTNKMMVASVVTSAGSLSVEGLGYEPVGRFLDGDEPIDPDRNATLQELVRTGALCNDSALHRHEGGWRIEGDPMEGALLALARRAGVDPSSLAGRSRADAIPFDARHRFMATLDRDPEGRAVASVKGAPERVLAMCRAHRAGPDADEPIDRAFWTEQADAIAERGQRVLAIAARTLEPEQRTIDFDDVEGSLTLLGLVGLIDPPRPEAIDAVAECHAAGIRVKMITGDHTRTAAAIARQVGLKSHDRVLTGVDLDRMDDPALASAVLETDVFARTSPEHKLRLVSALQSHSMTVAMTGDGVNDAPALKRADAGIAMGLKGSEAAKEAAELVLADDNFASIAAAVREGRTVYDNIKKVISWTLPTNAGEAMTILVALLFGMTLPITPVQILWVNLVTAVTLGLALAFEPTEPHTMRRPPRPRDQPILTGSLIWHIVFVSALFLFGVFGMYAYATGKGYDIELARTIALNTLVVMEIFHLFFIRNIYASSLSWRLIRGTTVIWASVISVAAAQFAITYIPLLQRAFDTRPVPFLDGLLIIAVGIALFAIIEIEKQLRLRTAITKPA